MEEAEVNVQLVDVGELVLHPDNPRQGDIGAIATSIERNGWYGALVVQTETNRVLVGNHRLQACKQLGFTHIPVHWVDVDDVTARRILLADNRSSDLATYNETDLVALLKTQAEVDDLIGTGFDGDDLDELLEELSSAEEASTDECYTPKWFFDNLGLEFDLDPCSCPPEFSNVPAKTLWTIEDDGLSKDWFGRVWMNPPFSKPDPWVTKFIENGHGVALLPVSGGAKWVYRLWNVPEARLVPWHDLFDRPDGTQYGIPLEMMIWAIGEECIEALSNFEHKPKTGFSKMLVR
jgi:hypothetical protein